MAYTTIDDPSAYFKVQLYTGTGAEHAVTFNDTDTDMQPDLVWLKNRTDAATNHCLTDSVRGATVCLFSNLTHANTTEAQALKSFDSDGFTLGTDTSVNTSSKNWVSWSWKADTSGSGTTTGSGTGTTYNYTVNTTAGFSIIKYGGNGTSGHTIPHHLGAAPKFLITKKISTTGDWHVAHQYNSAYPWNSYLYLNATDGTGEENSASWFLNSTAPTSTNITLGSGAGINASSTDYIIYAWAPKQGYSKFGSYEGNANADGPFVYTGFKPAWVIIKNIDSTQNWLVFDSKRPGYNVINDYMHPNTDDVEIDEANCIDFLSNGFKIRSTGNDRNGSGNTLVYMCFAEAPLVNSNGVPCNAR